MRQQLTYQIRNNKKSGHFSFLFMLFVAGHCFLKCGFWKNYMGFDGILRKFKKEEEEEEII